MTVNSVISSGTQSNIRSKRYQYRQAVAVADDTSIVLSGVDVATTSGATTVTFSSESLVYGQTQLANIRPGMIVILSATTDYTDSEVARTYVVSYEDYVLTTGLIDIAITTSMYVSVIRAYSPFFARYRTFEGGIARIDGSSFTRLPPSESALPTAVVLTRGTTSYNPTASPTAMDDLATSSFTYLWESDNSNDTVDDDEIASPTWTLQTANFRHLRCTITDSNGNSLTRIIAVWTVASDYSPNTSSAPPILPVGDNSGRVADIRRDGSGHTASITFNDATTSTPLLGQLRGSLYVVFSDVFIDETYDHTTIDFVGWDTAERNETNASERFGVESRTTLELENIGPVLSAVPAVPVALEESVDSGTNGETGADRIPGLTPARAMWHTLLHTPAQMLFSFSFPSDDEDYVGSGDFLSQQEDSVYEALQYQANGFNGILQFPVDGGICVDFDLRLANSTTRASAPFIVTLQSGDIQGRDIRPKSQNVAFNFATVYAGAYNTTTGEYTVYRAFSSLVRSMRGVQTIEKVNLVLPSDSTASEAQATVKQVAGDLLALNRSHDTVAVRLLAAYGDLVPDVASRVLLSVNALDNASGVSFTGSDYFQITSVTVSSNSNEATREVSVELRRETDGEDGVIGPPVIDGVDVVPPYVLPPFTGPEIDVEDWGDIFDPTPPDDQNPGGYCKTGGFRVPDSSGVLIQNSYATGGPAIVNPQFVNIGARGSGVISRDGTAWGYTWVNTPLGTYWDPYSPWYDQGAPDSVEPSFTDGKWRNGNSGDQDAVNIYQPNDNNIDCRIVRYFPTDVAVDAFEVIFDANVTRGDAGSPGSFIDETIRCVFLLNGSQVANKNMDLSEYRNEGLQETLVFSRTIEPAVDCDEVRVFLTPGEDGTADEGGIAQIISVRLEGPSNAPVDVPVEFIGDTVRGDAFYYGWNQEGGPFAYSSNNGMLVNATQLSEIPPYNEAHDYFIENVDIAAETGTRSFARFTFENEYEETPDNWSLQVKLCLGSAN